MSKIKLSASQKNDIARIYAKGKKTYKQLAAEYGVHKDTIYRAIKEVRVSKEPKKVEIAKPAPKVETKVEQPFIWNANSKFISITRGRETWNADKDHPAFKDALKELVEGNIEKARDLINIEKAVTKFVQGDIKIEGGSLFYQDIELRSGLIDRIIDSMHKGQDFKFYLPFLENLLENPSPKAVQRLFDFLVANDIEITADGHFIGWKLVRDNYTDCYTGKMDNSPGKEVKMARIHVNDNDQQTCSNGLHVCSKGYLSHYTGTRVVSVKVHPRDVVSIPVDYNDAKMRTCRYVVQEDVTERFKDII
ncbi:RIIB lysis inhibitor [Pectobacterium bacteriophage PM2]|uniref:Protector from prophage-induced early lysis n=1 Tax=Pectobacterium bacteriophage PM2 TaxID=1429794 RepID=A0A0A0Q0Z7_9CAUD|nr:RIIB lysis inhibitor [Pectobacterium bacteriophage PM2]AHY25253.1 protector from prophage-induced early lysis [Pectobacterium bacteriophage PM2]